MASAQRSHSARRDVVIVGDGIIALTTALALSRRGATVMVVGAPRPGRASTAAAGLLSPSVGELSPAVREFFTASRDLYPELVRQLADLSGRSVTLGPQGILEVAPDQALWDGLRAGAPTGSLALDPRAVHEMEPGLAPMAGALFHPADGLVDVHELMSALGAAAEHDSRVDLVRSDVAALEVDPPTVVAADGRRWRGATLVIAAGAWTPTLRGLPRALPAEPARGQMLPLAARSVSRAVMAPEGYLIPRGDITVVGSTLERVGFDPDTTPEGLDTLARVAASLAPRLAHAARQPGWAGLRPVTPDMLPILGRDPDWPNILYSCGHSKNGIMGAPLSAECVAALAVGEQPPRDISAFSVTRFMRQ